MIQKLWSHKPIRFLSVGIINTIIDFTLLNILVVLLHLPILLGNLISVSISVSISYFLNHYIVFENKNTLTIKTYIKFFFATGLTVLAVQSLVIHFTYPEMLKAVDNIASNTNSSHANFLNTHKKQIALNLSKAVGVICGLFINYLLYTRIIFKRNTEEEAIEKLMED